MSLTLISFLGKAVRRDGKPGYQPTTYLFGDGSEHEDTFFGRALARHVRPDSILLLGTAGSMWDVLAESLGHEGSDEWFAVAESAAQNAVTQEQLDALAPCVSERIGCACTLRLIPYAHTEGEQIAILKEMGKHGVAGDSVVIDVTHGFRTLPMLGLLAALFLERARNMTVKGIFYGAWDMRDDNNRAPVQRLDGMLHVSAWIQALSSFDESGNFSVFCDPLLRDGISPEAAAHLRRAAFHERTFNVNDATGDLRNLAHSLPEQLPGVGGLFAEQLGERLGWHKRQSLFARQRHLAQLYRERRDWVRCTVFAFEAFITGLLDVHEREKENVYEIRENARREFEERRRGDEKLRDDYYTLKNIRNYLAHGSVAGESATDSEWIARRREEILRIVKSEERLAGTLERVMRKLLPRT